MSKKNHKKQHEKDNMNMGTCTPPRCWAGGAGAAGWGASSHLNIVVIFSKNVSLLGIHTKCDFQILQQKTAEDISSAAAETGYLMHQREDIPPAATEDISSVEQGTRLLWRQRGRVRSH